jgi:hypothetical protein
MDLPNMVDELTTGKLYFKGASKRLEKIAEGKEK